MQVLHVRLLLCYIETWGHAGGSVVPSSVPSQATGGLWSKEKDQFLLSSSKQLEVRALIGADINESKNTKRKWKIVIASDGSKDSNMVTMLACLETAACRSTVKINCCFNKPIFKRNSQSWSFQTFLEYYLRSQMEIGYIWPYMIKVQ